jgi:glycosyltransferase involved in cell wall biosynthesis
MLEPGGAQQCAVQMTREFIKRGHICKTLFLYKKRDCFIGESNIDILFNKKPSIFHYPKIFIKLLIYLIKNKFDIAYSYGWTCNGFSIPATALASIPKRIAVQCSPTNKYAFIPKILDLLLGSTSAYSKNISSSNNVFEGFSKYPKTYREKLICIPNGADISASPLSKYEACKKLNLSMNIFNVGSVGRLSLVKNHSMVIKAIAQLENCNYYIVGGGELKEILMKLIKNLKVSDRVFLLGEMSNDQIKTYLRCLDLFAFPSLFESLSIALLEAAAASLPVLASNIPSTRELLPEGCIFCEDTIEDYMKGIKEIMNNPNKLLGSNNCKIAQSYSFKIMADRYLEVAL